MKLSEIIRTKKVAMPPRIILYGVPKIGKTTFASQSANPIMICTEDGARGFDVPCLPVVESWEDFWSQLMLIVEQGQEYQTIVIDTLDRLETLIFAEVARSKGKDCIEDIGYAKGYVFALEYWNRIIGVLDNLNDRGMSSILISHCLIKNFDPPGSDAYSRYRMSLHEKAAQVLTDWADIVLFANYKVITRGQGEVKKALPGHGERFLYTEERPSHAGGNRYSLDYEIPFTKTGSYDAVMNGVAEYYNEKSGDKTK